jgi:hypothetical protein
MTAKTLDLEQVTEFATAVRRALSDLGPDVLDDLTDGLEADLADKLADGEPLGDPGAYAAELRAAAGVSPAGRPSALGRAKEDLVAFKEGLQPLLRAPFIVGITAFLVSLRPAWWVLRGWTLFGLLNWRRQWSGVPDDIAQWALLAAFVVLSVQWGRGRWLPWRWSRPAAIGVSAVALLMVGPVIYYSQLQLQERNNYYAPSSGLALDGAQITNIFAFDAGGNPLADVQLFDQEGNPLNIAGQDVQYVEQYLSSGEYSFLMPNENVAGRKGWNVFPLQASEEALGWDLGDGNHASEVRPPLASVQPLLGYVVPSEEADEK